MAKITRTCPDCGQKVAEGNCDGSLVTGAKLLSNVAADKYAIADPMFTHVFTQVKVVHVERRGTIMHRITL